MYCNNLLRISNIALLRAGRIVVSQPLCYRSRLSEGEWSEHLHQSAHVVKYRGKCAEESALNECERRQEELRVTNWIKVLKTCAPQQKHCSQGNLVSGSKVRPSASVLCLRGRS